MINIHAVLAALLATVLGAQPPGTNTYRFGLTITGPLEHKNVPMDPVIDFTAIVESAELTGRLDPNTIEVIDAATGREVECAVTDDFAYGDTGRVEWVVEDPTHLKYEIRFQVTEKRPPLRPKDYTPLVGVGDLLRYNAGALRPICLAHSATLVDLNGDGMRDLVGCWNYAYRPGDPWDGVICYPRVGDPDDFEFGDLVRLRYVDRPGDTNLKHFEHIYMAVDLADFNHDGHADIVLTRRGTKTAAFYLNSGDRDAGGMPVFVPSGSAPVSGWAACRAVDLDADGAVDLVVDGEYLRNTNSQGWPFQADSPIRLDAGRKACYVDLDQDGLLDAVCLEGGPTAQPDGYRIAWRRNQGGHPPTFGPQQRLESIDAQWCSMVAESEDAGHVGLLVQNQVFERLSFHQVVSSEDKEPKFKSGRRAGSKSAVLALGDQAWPHPCDWDADGDLDLLVGSGYGWPRIVINQGTKTRPAYAEAKQIIADGKPIRFVRNDILGEPHHTHDMGYPYPIFVDWDADGLPDLVCPNETNRIFWYKNIGTPTSPLFGKQEQVIVDGYPDSPKARKLSADRALSATYPQEEEQPFFWRTGAAAADFNGDGLTDLVTLDGHTRRATLFAQYRSADGRLRLRKDRVLELVDGRPIDDRIVERKAHWTESFRPIDWDGDGLTDLIYGLAGAHSGTLDGGSIYLLRNAGTKTEPVFQPPRTMRCFGEPIRITNHGPHPWPCDIDHDGKPDLVTCVEWSVYPFYRHAALEMKARPEVTIGPLERLR